MTDDLERKLTTFNERVRLLANTVNAVALGIAGVALLTPLLTSGQGANHVSWPPLGIAVAMHVAAHYILGLMR